MELRDRVALVTGGAHRIGRALVMALAREGADVVIHYHGSGDKAEGTAAAVRALGRRAVTLQADLGDAEQATGLAERAVAALGRLDVLVNSAALFESKPFLEIDAGDWDRVMAVNVRAPFLLLQATAPHLAASNGVAINIADLSGLRPWKAFPHHSVSKAALVHLTRVAARALAPDVRVNGIAPGAVLPPESYSDDQLRDAAARTVLQRIGAPEDVVEALLFLVRSEFTTGEIVVVDGGRMLN